MRRRAVFLDVDGTLLNQRGLVPDSARSAVQQARANGHLVFLCTGRSLAALRPEIMDVGFDGVVASAGAYVEVRGQVLVHHHIPADEVAHVIDFFGVRGVEYILESHDALYASPGLPQRLRDLVLGSIADPDLGAQSESGLSAFLDSVRVGVGPSSAARISKVSFLDSEVTLEEIRGEFAAALEVIPVTVASLGPNSGELTLPGIHKAAGIVLLTEHVRINREDTLAIGDGANDLEMLGHVGVGIAMGNAPQAVKDAADEVTGTADEGGIHAALTRHGLIGGPGHRLP